MWSDSDRPATSLQDPQACRPQKARLTGDKQRAPACSRDTKASGRKPTRAERGSCGAGAYPSGEYSRLKTAPWVRVLRYTESAGWIEPYRFVIVRKLSRAGSTNSPRPRLRSLSHPNSRAPGPPRPAPRPCRLRWPALQSGLERLRGEDDGDSSACAAAADSSRAPGAASSPARSADDSAGPPGRRGLRAAGGGGAASAPCCGGAGRGAGEGGLEAAAGPPRGGGSSAPAAPSPPGLWGPKGNMTNTPAPYSGPLSRRPTTQRSRSSRHFRVPRPKSAGWETRVTARLPSVGDRKAGTPPSRERPCPGGL